MQEIEIEDTRKKLERIVNELEEYLVENVPLVSSTAARNGQNRLGSASPYEKVS